MPVASTTADEVQRLLRSAGAWRARSHRDVAGLAAACRRALGEVADAWVAASSHAKGWAHVPESAAEEWLSGPLPVARFLALVQQLHEALADGRLPPLRALPAPTGQSAFAGLPARGLGDPLLLAGVRARITCDGAVAPTPPPRRGDVALVLGAGNVTATPVLDVLHQVFLEGRAVSLKASPLHEKVLPWLQRALSPLADAGLLDTCCGDGALGRDLAAQPGFAAIHLTGSTATWSELRAAQRNRALSAEVGCCTPVLVLPGVWRRRELTSAARQLAAAVATNGGATCLAPRLVLTARQWPQRAEFLDLVRTALGPHGPRVPFHPGAYVAFAVASGRDAVDEALPPTLRPDLHPERDADLLAQEHFAPVLLELPLDASSPHEWTAVAAATVRERVFGSLAAYVFAPRSVPQNDVETSVRALPHGTVAVNCWAGLGYGLGTVPWGVPAGRHWQHGVGWSRGTACLPAVRSVVVEAPLRAVPRPPWLRSGRDGAALSRALTRHLLAPSFGRLAAAALHALRSP